MLSWGGGGPRCIEVGDSVLWLSGFTLTFGLTQAQDVPERDHTNPQVRGGGGACSVRRMRM